MKVFFVYPRRSLSENLYGCTVLRIGADSEDMALYLTWSPHRNEILYSVYLSKQGIGAIDKLNASTAKSQRFVTLKDQYPYVPQCFAPLGGPLCS